MKQKNTINNNKKSAFTLAEVLITLGVIGVVAAITMPALINNFQVSSWENSLKKSYATITNGFHAIASDYDGDLRNSGIFDDIDDSTFSDRIDEAVRKHFKVIKSCKIGDTTNCPGYYNSPLLGTQRKITFETNYDYFNAKNFYVAYLADGSIISMKNGKCIEMNYKDESKFKHYCTTVYLDINGQKNPNIRGKDVFQLASMDEKGNLYPDTSIEWAKASYGSENALTGSQYWQNAVDQCGTPNKKIKDETTTYISGQNCLARIMENGWKMDYLK